MSRRGWSIYAFFILLFGVFSYFTHRFDYFPGDIAVSQWLQGIGAAWLQTFCFAPYIVGGLAVFFGLKLWLPSRRLELISIGMSAGVTGIVGWLAKVLTARPRPGAELVQVMVGTQGLSFPSVHVALAAIICGFAFYLAPRLVKSPQGAGWLRALLAVSILAIGFSRVYLGAHWTSDVAGGLFLGGLVLYPTIAVYRKYDLYRKLDAERDAKAKKGADNARAA